MEENEKDTHNPIIELENVSVVLDNKPVLRNINFKINRGEYVGIIGKNGSGKTTLIKTIIGLIKPDKGTIKIFGKPFNPQALTKIGYVPQMNSIKRTFPASVQDVVSMGLFKRHKFRRLSDQDKEKIMLALHKVKMEDFIHRPIGHLSGGEQQKVLLAQALVSDPEILLLDEPTNALDFVMIRDFLDLLRDLNTRFTLTLLVIQHNLELLRPFCSRLIMIKRSIFFDGLPSDKNADNMIQKVFSN
jgi:zinc transport system ATP-binding protein